MKRLLLLIVAVLIHPLASADDFGSTISEFRQAPQTAPFFDGAYGYAVFPAVGKGGIGVGGAFGQGQVYRGGAATGKSKLVQVTFGFQLGGQAFSQIVFLQDKRAYDEFTSGSFEFGAQASAVAITLGASAQAGTTGTGAQAGGNQTKANYVGGYAIFTSAKGGLMYEATIGGQTFTFDAY